MHNHRTTHWNRRFVIISSGLSYISRVYVTQIQILPLGAAILKTYNYIYDAIYNLSSHMAARVMWRANQQHHVQNFSSDDQTTRTATIVNSFNGIITNCRTPIWISSGLKQKRGGSHIDLALLGRSFTRQGNQTQPKPICMQMRLNQHTRVIHCGLRMD